MTVVADRAARVILWGALLFGGIGALGMSYAADAHGRPSLLRWGAGLVALAGVAGFGLWSSRPSGRMGA